MSSSARDPVGEARASPRTRRHWSGSRATTATTSRYWRARSPRTTPSSTGSSTRWPPRSAENSPAGPSPCWDSPSRRSPTISVTPRRWRSSIGSSPAVLSCGPSTPPWATVRREAVEVTADAYAAADGADVLVVLTEWDEFRWLDFERIGGLMHRRVIVDGRNLLDRSSLRRAGFVVDGLGRTD